MNIKDFFKSKAGKITMIVGIIVVLSFFYALGTGKLNNNLESDEIEQTSDTTTTISLSTSEKPVETTNASEKTETTSLSSENITSTITDAEETESKYKLKTGELLDVKEIDNVLIIKAKITSQLTNKLTIAQNYHNVEDIIKNQGGDEFSEIQYWAVADMSNGEESKVISFTVSSEVIEGTSLGDIVAIQYPDLVTDLWILPSLTE